jgi:hypothetical protein
VSPGGFYNTFRIICQKSSGDFVVGIASWEISGVPISLVPTINTSVFKRGTGSLQLAKTNKQFVSLPSFTTSANGFSVATWIRGGTDASNAAIFEYATSPVINTFSVNFVSSYATGSYTTTATDTISIELWFKIITDSIGTTVVINNSLWIGVRLNRIELWTSTSGSKNLYPTIPLDQWHHIVIIYIHPSTTAFIYLNAELIGSLGISANYSTTGSGISIAGRSNNTELNGGITIDQFRIWNYQRTATEVFNAYNRRYYLSTTGLVCYLPMNEGTGTTLSNQASGQSNFTIMNTNATWNTDVAYNTHLSNIITMKLTAGMPTLYAGTSVYTSPVSVVDNSWNHLAWAINSSGVWNLYINGVQYNTGITQTVAAGTTYIANYIGRYATDTALANTANIYVDDFRDFNRGIDLSYVQFLYG